MACDLLNRGRISAGFPEPQHRMKHLRWILALARDVQDGVAAFTVLLQSFDGFGSRQNQQLDIAMLGFAVHLLHHGEFSMHSAADKKPVTLPRDLLLSMESGVCPNSSRNRLEGFFFRLRTLPRSITTS